MDKNTPGHAEEIENPARRAILTKSAYATPLLMTMHVTPSLAQTGSNTPCVYDPADHTNPCPS